MRRRFCSSHVSYRYFVRDVQVPIGIHTLSDRDESGSVGEEFEKQSKLPGSCTCPVFPRNSLPVKLGLARCVSRAFTPVQSPPADPPFRLARGTAGTQNVRIERHEECRVPVDGHAERAAREFSASARGARYFPGPG